MALESLDRLGFGGADTSKIIAEIRGLTISGPLTGAGSGVAIPVTGIEAEDTILKAIAFGGSGSPDGVGMEDVTSLVTISDRRAVGTLTVAAGISDGDAIVVNGKTITFTDLKETIATNVGPGIVPFEEGEDDEEYVAARLAQVIMSGDSSLTCTVSGAVVTVYARTAGTGGNSKTLVVTGSGGHVTRSGANLAGGTAANSIKISTSTTDRAVLLFWYNKNA